MRCLLKRTEPFIVEALFPLFELLHHYWINQPQREATLASLASTFAVPVFGAPAEHGAGPEAAIFLQDAAALLIAEYRPLFTQPYNLQRYDADLARQASAAEAKATAAETRAAQELHNNTIVATAMRLSPLRVCSSASDAYLSTSPSLGNTDWAEVGSPLLTPRRMGALSVMEPAEPLLGCSPDENSPLWSLFLSSSVSPINATNYSISGGHSMPTTITSSGHQIEDMEMLLDGMLESTVSAAFGGASAGITTTITTTHAVDITTTGTKFHGTSVYEQHQQKNSPVSIFLSGGEMASRETSTEASVSPCDMLSDSSDCDADLPQAQALVAAAAVACAQLPGAAC
jgi:hypothetical protein